MANGYHRGINKADTCASPEPLDVQEKHKLKENPALQLHEADV